MFLHISLRMDGALKHRRGPSFHFKMSDIKHFGSNLLF